MPALPRSALARPLDLTVPSNRVAALGALAALLFARRRGRTWVQAADVAGTCFLAWATARELDPDFPMTANLALPVAFVAQPGTGGGTLAGAGVLSALRVLASTTGEGPTVPDHVGLLLQAGVGARVNRAAALLPAVAALAAGRGAAAALPALGLLVPAAPVTPTSLRGSLPLLAALLVAPALTTPEAVTSACDRAPRGVRAADVRVARGVAVAALALGVLTRRSAGLVPAASAALTVGLRRAWREDAGRSGF